MLALADRNGEIQASIPGLARLAGVPIPDCEEAIAKFTAPDQYSRTPDDQGRRIEKIEGGWALLNHSKYREMASRDDSKAANAERQQRHREKAKRNAIVTPSNAKVTQTLHIAEAEAEAEAENKNTEAPVPVALSLRLDQPPTTDKKFNAAEASIPSTIDSPEFRAAWADWCQYRRESGHTMKSRTAHAQLAEMAGWGKVESIAAIRQSIRQGWRGVFKPDANQRKPAQESEFANAF